MQIDISNLAYIAGEVLGIGEFAGGVFCTFAVFVAVVVIVAFASKGQLSPETILVLTVLVAGLALALGWVNIWLPLLMVLVLIFYMVAKGTGGFGGK